MRKGESYINARTGKRVRFGRLVRMHANDRQTSTQAKPATSSPSSASIVPPGDTFCGEGVELLARKHLRARAGDPAVDRADQARRRRQARARPWNGSAAKIPTFRVSSDPETGETIIAGMGQLHLEIYVERIKREYRCECLIGEPKVAYRECPTKTVEFNYKHKKQTGGSGQYAHVVGKMEPLPEDADPTLRVRQRGHAGPHSEGVHSRRR